MNEKLIIRNGSLRRLFEHLQKSGKAIYAPVNKDGKSEFDILIDFNNFHEDYIQTVQSAKSVVFPRYETILKYKKEFRVQSSELTPEPETQNPKLVIDDIDLSTFPATVLFGVHPCDAAGFDVLKSVFTGEYKDKFFADRMEKVTIISMSCSKSDDFCFCTSVGLAPDSIKGSDILLTKLSSGDYLADIISEKGKAIVNLAPELFETSANAKHETLNTKLVADVPVKFDVKQVNSKLGNVFESPVWLAQSLRCLGCGACAFVCPTCSCFDIQDEGNSICGSRIKCWDSCGFSNFTLHASKHNPRDEQSQRWRQRVLHKFSYQPEQLKIYGCVGCGRCSRACPVDMNLQEHLTAISNEQ